MAAAKSHLLTPKKFAPPTNQGKELLSEVLGAVASTAERGDTKMSAVAVAADKAKLGEAVKALPTFQYMTNSEPWYTKRSRWSSIIGPASMVIGLALRATGTDFNIGPTEQALVADTLTAIGAVIAGWFAYRAGTATKPLGS